MAAIAALGMNAGQFNNEVTYTKRGTTFALVAQKAQSVNLNIYAEGTGGKPVKTDKPLRVKVGGEDAAMFRLTPIKK